MAGVAVKLSRETRSAQARYAITVRNHPDDEAKIAPARRAFAECLAADLRRRAEELESAR